MTKQGVRSDDVIVWVTQYHQICQKPLFLGESCTVYLSNSCQKHLYSMFKNFMVLAGVGGGIAPCPPPYKYAIVYERACRPSALINHRKPLKASIDSCTVGLWLTNKTIFLAVITDNLSTNLILSNAWALDRIKYYVRLNVTITFAIARSARISQTSAKLRVLFTICEFCGVSEPAKFFQLAYFAVVEIRLKTPGSGS